MAVVAISRKVGSYGDEIAALVAQRLGYRLVDRERVHRLAQECDDEFRRVCAVFEAEEGQGGLWEHLVFGDPAHTALFAALNLELAAQGDVVLVGRGAQVVLQGVPGVFKARIVAPKALRVERIMALRGLGQEEALDYVSRHDEQRRALIQSVFRADLGDWSLYDLVLNTAGLAKEAAAEVIVRGVELMPAPADPAALGQSLKDRAFAKRLESALKRRILTSGYHDIQVTARGGAITLNGVLADRRSKEKAERIARDLPGVTSVDNQLKFTDLSF